MRKLTWVIGILFGLSLQAAVTTLEFDTVLRISEGGPVEDVSISDLNKVLRGQGFDGIPKKVVVSDNPEPVWELVMSRIEAAEAVTGRKYLTVLDKSLLHEYPKMCYRGEAAAVPSILESMQGNFLKEVDYLAIRYGKNKIIKDEIFRSNSQKEVNAHFLDECEDKVATWFGFDTTSDSILVMSDMGDGGDESNLQTTVIRRCEEKDYSEYKEE